MQVKYEKKAKCENTDSGKKLVWNLENGKIAIAIYQLLFNIQSLPKTEKRYDAQM